MADTTEDRLRLLEASVEVQEEVMVALQTERLDAARLSDSVERLSLGADALAAALLLVDKNQKSITRLDKEIKAVEDKVVPAEQIEHQITKTRRRLIAIVAAVLVVSLLAVGIGVRYAQDRKREAYANCQQRAATSNAIQDYLKAVAKQSTNLELKASAQKIVDLYPANPRPCEKP